MQSELEGEKKTEPQSAKGSHPGTVPVLYKKIIATRKALGYSQRTLAKLAYCSHTTLKSIESGKDAFPSTIEKIAKPLGLKLADLTEGLESEVEPTDKMAAKRQVHVRIFFRASYENFDETKLSKLVEQLRERHQAEGEITVVTVEDGSVIVVLEMDEETAMAMIRMLAREDTPGLPPVSSLGIRTADLSIETRLSEKSLGDLFDLSKSKGTRFRYRSVDVAGFFTISKHYPIKNKFIFYAQSVLIYFTKLRLSVAYNTPVITYHVFSTIFVLARYALMIVSALSPSIMENYHERKLDLLMVAIDGQVPFDWGLTLRLWGVVISNIINIATVNKIKEKSFKTIVVASFAINVLFFVMFYCL